MIKKSRKEYRIWLAMKARCYAPSCKNMSFEKAISGDVYHRQIFINGESKTVREWCDVFGLKPGSVYSRIHRGASPIDALTINQEVIKK